MPESMGHLLHRKHVPVGFLPNRRAPRGDEVVLERSSSGSAGQGSGFSIRLLQREIGRKARPERPEHGTGSRAVPLGLGRTVISAHYRIAAWCSTLKPVRLRTAW